MTSKGQITLPKEIRDRLGVRAGDRVRFRETAEGAIVVEAEAVDLMTLFGALSPPQGRRISIEEMDAAIRRSGGRRAVRRPGSSREAHVSPAQPGRGPG